MVCFCNHAARTHSAMRLNCQSRHDQAPPACSVGTPQSLDRSLLRQLGFGGFLPLVALAIAAAVVIIAPQRIYRRLRYRLTGQVLQVLRGWLFHADTVVPLVRVQHLDVIRGPFDKMFGTASLVVHTAGTHNSMVALPGLSPEHAAEMRDIIREHVRSDFA